MCICTSLLFTTLLCVPLLLIDVRFLPRILSRKGISDCGTINCRSEFLKLCYLKMTNSVGQTSKKQILSRSFHYLCRRSDFDLTISRFTLFYVMLKVTVPPYTFSSIDDTIKNTLFYVLSDNFSCTSPDLFLPLLNLIDKISCFIFRLITIYFQ